MVSQMGSVAVLRFPEIYARTAPGLELREVSPSVSLTAAWQQSIKQARVEQASDYRRMLEALVDEQPTWHDAEWQ